MGAQWLDASHNLWFRLENTPNKWVEDLNKSGEGTLVGYQECGGDGQRKTLKEWCEKNDRGLYHPKGCGTPISWKKDEWTPWGLDGKPFKGVVDSHLGAMAMGVNAKFNPAREFTYVGLKHNSSGRTVLRINVHPLAGGTRAPGVKEDQDKPALDAYKNWGISQYWLDVVSFASAQMSVNEGTKSFKRFWDCILMGGDYNGDFLDQKGDQWYYPNKLLPALFAPDQQKGGLDHMQHAHGSDVKVVKRWSEPGHTDHRIHFIRREFVAVADTPGN